MAKNQSLKIKSGHTCTATSCGSGEFTLTVTGRNSKGTLVKVSAVFCDWNIPSLAKELLAITKRRVESANQLHNSVKSILST